MFLFSSGGDLMAHMCLWLQLTKLQISLDVALIHFLFDLALMFICEVFSWFFPWLFTFMSINDLGISSDGLLKCQISNFKLRILFIFNFQLLKSSLKLRKRNSLLANIFFVGPTRNFFSQLK